jgi:hypothetical protein
MGEHHHTYSPAAASSATRLELCASRDGHYRPDHKQQSTTLVTKEIF